jgi:hypothetical protein
VDPGEPVIVAEVKKVERVVVTMSYDDAKAIESYLYERCELMFGFPKAMRGLYEALVQASQG